MSSKKFSASMFDALKSTMAEQRSGGSFKDIMKTQMGNNYIVRLVPNMDDVAKTTHHYFSHGWRSNATGQFVSCICPTTFGKRCPICEERVRLYRGDDEDTANAKLLGKKEQWLVNVYVIDDPTNKENNGEVKILRYGKQLDKIIRDAMDGIDKDEFGARIFDLTEDGCNLRIAVEKNDGGYPTYVSSKFLRESEIEGMNDAKVDETHEGIFDLEKVFDHKTPEEVKEILDTHFFCEISSSTTEIKEETTTEVSSSGSTTEVDIEEKEDDDPSIDDENVQDKLDDLMKDL